MQQVVVELSVQLVNAVFFLLPNAYLIVPSHHCGWFDGVVTWSSFVRCTIRYAVLRCAIVLRRAAPRRAALLRPGRQYRRAPPCPPGSLPLSCPL